MKYKYRHNTTYNEKAGKGKKYKEQTISNRYFKKPKRKIKNRNVKNRNYFKYEMIKKEELKEKINRNLKPITFFYYNLWKTFKKIRSKKPWIKKKNKY